MNIETILQLKSEDLQQRIGRAKQLKEDCETLTKKLRFLRRDVRSLEQAQIIVQNVAKITQNQLQYKISEIVSLALSSVFNDPYTFEIEFVEKRGKTECDLWFVKDGQRIDPMTASGGGVIDVACLALRIALWKLSSQKTDAVFILDEPFPHLSSNLQERAMKMVKALSEELKLQIIMISHYADVVDSADNIIDVSIKKGVSNITCSGL